MLDRIDVSLRTPPTFHDGDYRQYRLMVADHAQYSRPAGGPVRAFRYVPLVLCTAVTTSVLTWTVAVQTTSAADVMRFGGALLSGANCSNTTTTTSTATAAGSYAKEEDHRKAVIDRLYNGHDAADHLGSMKLLDPEVGRLVPPVFRARAWPGCCPAVALSQAQRAIHSMVRRSSKRSVWVMPHRLRTQCNGATNAKDAPQQGPAACTSTAAYTGSCKPVLPDPSRHPEAYNPAAQRMPPFTMEAQRWIWERQNPPPSRCREQTFLLGYVEVRFASARVQAPPAVRDPNIVPSAVCRW